MKYALAALALAAAARAQTRDDIPECALPCLDNAITSVTDCAIDDYPCVCGQFDAIQAVAVTCVLNSCSGEELAAVIPAVTALCEAQGTPDDGADDGDDTEEPTETPTETPEETVTVTEEPTETPTDDHEDDEDDHHDDHSSKVVTETSTDVVTTTTTYESTSTWETTVGSVPTDEPTHGSNSTTTAPTQEPTAGAAGFAPVGGVALAALLFAL